MTFDENQDLKVDWGEIEARAKKELDSEYASSEPYEPNVVSMDNELFHLAASDFISPPRADHLTQFTMIDRMIGGFRPKEFTILCGSTGSGKTTLCTNIAFDLMVQKVPMFIANIETGYLDFVRRLYCVAEKKNWNQGQKISPAELKHFSWKWKDTFVSSPLHFSKYENRFSVETLMTDIEFYKRKHGVRFAIVDNLNFFLEVTSYQNQNIEMDRVIHELIMFVREVDIHMIMVMHPRKTDGSRISHVDHIKGSSTANQEAQNIFLFNRLPEANPGARELTLAKSRRKGEFVGKSVILNTKTGTNYEEVGMSDG